MTRPFPKSQTVLRKCSKVLPVLALAWLGLSGLAACSAVPDAANPIEWYRGVSSLFDDEEQQQERAAAKTARETTPLPGTGQDYPNLGTVPERPRVTPEMERQRTAQGLAADRENARYAEGQPGEPGQTSQTSQTGQGGAASATSSAASSAPAVSPLPEPPPPEAAAPVATPRVSQPSVSQPPSAPPPAPELTPPPAQDTPAAPVTARETPIPVASSSQGPGTGFPLGMTQAATLYFGINSAALDAEGRRALRLLAAGFKENAGYLRIVGYASTERATAAAQIANFRIAVQRAEVVAQELTRLGVPRERMMVSTGSTRGQGSLATDRRVEVALDY